MNIASVKLFLKEFRIERTLCTKFFILLSFSILSFIFLIVFITTSLFFFKISINPFILPVSAVITFLILLASKFYFFKEYRLKKFFASLFFTHMVPGVLYLLLFFIINMTAIRYLNIHLKETFTGLILLYTCFSLPFSILMFTKYFNSIPQDYDNQAMINGCTGSVVLFKIIISISMPGIYTIGKYSFLISWNEILFSSILTRPGMRTISVSLLEIKNEPHVMAACVIITIPVLIIFSYFRKYCISGLAGTGLK